MSKQITIFETDPNSKDAIFLMEELSSTLESITGSSGKSSFSTTDINENHGVFAIAYSEKEEPVGCGAIRRINDKTAEVKRMYAKDQGVGIGTKMLDYLETKAREMGYELLVLETRLINSNAVFFYENRGYNRIPNYGKYIGRVEAVCFQKVLKSEGAL